MANETNDLRQKLTQYRLENGLMQETLCTEEESNEYLNILNEGGTLPEDVVVKQYNTTAIPEFYRVTMTNLTDDEIEEYLKLKQASDIGTIKKCVQFFTVLTVIGLVFLFLSILKIRF